MSSLCICNLGLLVTCAPETLTKTATSSAKPTGTEPSSPKRRHASDDPLGRVLGPAVIFIDENKKVKYCGSEVDCPFSFTDEADVTVDGSGLIALPGLVDCHTHAVWAGSRAEEFAERLRGVSYVDIQLRGGGINSTTRATRAASVAELYASAQARVDKLVRINGATTVEIKSGYGLSVEAEAKMLEVADKIRVKSNGVGAGGRAEGPRVVRTFLGAHLVPSEFRDDKEKYVRQVISEQIPRCKGIADHIDVFVDKGAFTLDEGRRILEAGKQAGMKIKAHAEQIEHTGVAKLVADMGGLSADHLERVDAEAASEMAKKNVVGVLLPGAQWYLKDIPPPAPMLREHGVKMAVSTDLNPGSSPVYDLIQCATMCCVMQGLTPEEAILGVTRHAGLALGDDRLGWLGPGSVGDVAIFRPPPGEAATIESLIQFSGGYECVSCVRDGSLLFNSGLPTSSSAGLGKRKKISKQASL
ncbi:unnamed protein product [Amoebophrya sp. A25]|nr:unnamed protein product [Amoebophrya sp. A25]|eukprot:GSA25T00027327001.1